MADLSVRVITREQYDDGCFVLFSHAGPAIVIPKQVQDLIGLAGLGIVSCESGRDLI